MKIFIREQIFARRNFIFRSNSSLFFVQAGFIRISRFSSNSTDLVYNNIQERVRWKIVNYERDLIVTAGFEYNGIRSAIVTNVGILHFLISF